MGIFDLPQKPKIFSPLVLVREGGPQSDGVYEGLNVSRKLRLIDKSEEDTAKSFAPGQVPLTSLGHAPFSYAVYENCFSGHLCCCHQNVYGVPVSQYFPSLNPYLNFHFGKVGYGEERLRGNVSVDGDPRLQPESRLTTDQESLETFQTPDASIQLEHFCGNDASSPISFKHHKLTGSQRVGQRRTRRPKTYKCPYCDVCCSNQGQLRGHVRIHTGERPYRCSEKGCTKAFIRNEELTRHRRIHTGERPHKCAVCGKAFSRKDHLNKHVRVHAYENDHKNNLI